MKAALFLKRIRKTGSGFFLIGINKPTALVQMKKYSLATRTYQYAQHSL
jgi:hypothetical protein